MLASEMFEIAETGARLDKQEYEKRMPDLRVGLVNAQYDLMQADFPVIIAIDGNDWQSVKDALLGFNDWMDGRYIKFHAMDAPLAQDAGRPTLWRFWNRLPGKGEIAVFASAWTVGVIRDRVLNDLDDESFEHRLRQIRRFEQDQANEGALILKFWLHLPKKEFKKRVKNGKGAKNGRNGKGRKKKARSLGPPGFAEGYDEHYDEIIDCASRLIEVTDEPASAWHIVESTDRRHLASTIGETVLGALRARLDSPPVGPRAQVPEPTVTVRDESVLDTVDLDKKLERTAYKRQLAKYQKRLLDLTAEAYERGISGVIAFEGWDAAGKGGVIRRIVRAADIRRCRVEPIAAPTEEELAHHHLWRFWSRLPRPGEMVIFDRTWYGRVLVERVEGFAERADWRRAYNEINHFESQLTDAGVVVCKFWLHIDPDEQLERFRAREQTPYKKYKITEEDYRNRENWGAYVEAVDEMVARTNTTNAPWELVPANDKPYARVKVLKTICAAYKAAL